MNVSQKRAYHMVDPRAPLRSTVAIRDELRDSQTLSQLLSTDAPGRSASFPPSSASYFRRRDTTARIRGVSGGVAVSPEAAERRLMYLAERQAAYDEIAARPRGPAPRDAFAETRAFQNKLDDVIGPSAIKEDTRQRILVHEQKIAQKAEQRHFEWQRSVYKPVVEAVGRAVDAQSGVVGDLRRTAYEGFLAASAGRKGIFLEDKAGTYDPYTVARAGIRVTVPVNAVDPLRATISKHLAEARIVDPTAGMTGELYRETLPAQQWTAAAQESTIYGHFAIKEAAGALTNPFGDRDTASTVELKHYTSRGPLVDGRQPEIDAEFPKGKRVNYPYRMVGTGAFLPHGSADVYAGDDGIFTDRAVVDVVRATLTERHMRASAADGKGQ